MWNAAHAPVPSVNEHVVFGADPETGEAKSVVVSPTQVPAMAAPPGHMIVPAGFLAKLEEKLPKSPMARMGIEGALGAALVGIGVLIGKKMKGRR